LSPKVDKLRQFDLLIVQLVKLNDVTKHTKTFISFIIFSYYNYVRKWTNYCDG